MVGTPRSGVGETAIHALDDVAIRNLDFHHEVNVDAGVLYCLGLRNSARKTIQHEAIGAVCFFDAFFHQVDDDVVRYQSTRSHYLIGRSP